MFDATLKDRKNSFHAAPGTSMFIHWLVGMVYVFYFASFILLLREVLRPGVLWFLRNLNDPEFNPIQEVGGSTLWFTRTIWIARFYKITWGIDIAHDLDDWWYKCISIYFADDSSTSVPTCKKISSICCKYLNILQYLKIKLLSVLYLINLHISHVPVYTDVSILSAFKVIFGSTVLLMLWLPARVIRKVFASFLPYHVMLSR